ncbi:MFS transporter permease [Enterovibrio norvegicus]|uniref:Predicted arabinose efflux permease, MFS family n=1 Tax=Enterovibrio norvegicus DSM 15893 TaxID=1121869 RepID=A0A1I5KF13_9GAMM|nr:organoarsenical effux MFS transporter ArsJ [Enterovibrio norvegicus]OEF49335.1 MFS transporter permease [Enterovibrio norvegicus]SFO83303.1 Predicted arabinose efflux permease, MFS family [Enterovibrio norvegicus DSM 15893]
MPFASLSTEIKQYLIVTGNYWAFTLTDGALRMLVVLHFNALGYSPLEIAMLFLFYEFFGVVTNLVGGWLGAHIGLNRTMNIGLGLQIVALGMLLVPAGMLTVAWVMAAQALSGIAKDLNKMSAKSAVKTLVPENAEGTLYKWVAALTGSKNALKGAGFFLGGALLSVLGFQGAVAVMAAMLLLVWIGSLLSLKAKLGTSKSKPKFTQIFSKSVPINVLSAARMFLFGARDVWFVVALPVFLTTQLGWDHWYVGGFLAAWVMAYGIVQGFAPKITGKAQGKTPDGRSAMYWAAGLAIIPALIALALSQSLAPEISIVVGLLVFGGVFAINSSLHSYLIVSYARSDGASLDVGFYYMANALGRLFGTLLSGWVYQAYGLEACLWISSAMLTTASVVSYWLPRQIEVETRIS